MATEGDDFNRGYNEAPDVRVTYRSTNFKAVSYPVTEEMMRVRREVEARSERFTEIMRSSASFSEAVRRSMNEGIGGA